jgi:hypothetical protein
MKFERLFTHVYLKRLTVGTKKLVVEVVTVGDPLECCCLT